MPAFIAKESSTGLHVFFRVVDKESTCESTRANLSAFINSLTSVKGHKQLASIVGGSGLLFNEGVEASPREARRAMTPERCVEELNEHYVPVDASLLAKEMHLYSPTERRSNSSKQSPAASLDAFKNDFPSILAGLGGNAVVLAEPVQDWMMFRNSISICAALLSAVDEGAREGDFIESKGFVKHVLKPFGDIVAAPLKYGGPFFSYFKSSEAFLYATTNHAVDNGGLFRRLVDDPQVPGCRGSVERIPFVSSRARLESCCEKSSSKVFVAPPFDILENPSNCFSSYHGNWDSIRKTLRDRSGDDENLYICACVSPGESDLDVAKKILRSFWTAAQNMTGQYGETLGAVPDSGDLFNPERTTMKVAFKSLVSKSFDALFYHAGRRLVACKRCGCGILASNKGPVREYCSDSCRMQDKE